MSLIPFILDLADELHSLVEHDDYACGVCTNSSLQQPSPAPQQQKSCTHPTYPKHPLCELSPSCLRRPRLCRQLLLSGLPETAALAEAASFKLRYHPYCGAAKARPIAVHCHKDTSAAAGNKETAAAAAAASGSVTAPNKASYSVVNKNGFQVSMNVKQFAADELTVKTIDNCIVVEGRHEEKEDGHGVISRHFIRKYTLPRGYDPQDVLSTLSSDGILTVRAPTPAGKGSPEMAMPETRTPQGEQPRKESRQGVLADAEPQAANGELDAVGHVDPASSSVAQACNGAVATTTANNNAVTTMEVVGENDDEETGRAVESLSADDGAHISSRKPTAESEQVAETGVTNNAESICDALVEAENEMADGGNNDPTTPNAITVSDSANNNENERDNNASIDDDDDAVAAANNNNNNNNINEDDNNVAPRAAIENASSSSVDNKLAGEVAAPANGCASAAAAGNGTAEDEVEPQVPLAAPGQEEPLIADNNTMLDTKVADSKKLDLGKELTASLVEPIQVVVGSGETLLLAAGGVEADCGGNGTEKPNDPILAAVSIGNDTE